MAHLRPIIVINASAAKGFLLPVTAKTIIVGHRALSICQYEASRPSSLTRTRTMAAHKRLVKSHMGTVNAHLSKLTGAPNATSVLDTSDNLTGRLLPMDMQHRPWKCIHVRRASFLLSARAQCHQEQRSDIIPRTKPVAKTCPRRIENMYSRCWWSIASFSSHFYIMASHFCVTILVLRLIFR